MRETFEADGYCILPDVVPAEWCERSIANLRDYCTDRPGFRSLLVESWCRNIAEVIRQHSEIIPLLSASAIAVQCTLFDKSPDKNWHVGWHQDLAIPVRERTNDSRCRGWSVKEGTWFVQPPVEVLSQLLAVRLQLDEAGESDGALRVIPQSHLLGRLDSEAIVKLGRECQQRLCCVSRGGVLVMRPLLVHSSTKTQEKRRRVLHFLFGPRELPCGLTWC